MSISDPKVTVMCDQCKYEQDYEMCSLVRKSWDLRYLDDQLKRDGWRTDGDDLHTCEGCIDEPEVMAG